jgi:hypothetical protein
MTPLTGEYISFYVDFSASKIPFKYQNLQYKFASREITDFAWLKTHSKISCFN